MSTELEPVLGNWYQHLDKGQLFTVVSIDSDSDTVELQHFDGDIEEIELAAWYDMDLELADAPEDWTGPVDDVERDDIGYTETDMSPDDWREPLQSTRRAAQEPWEETEPEDERDDWAEGENSEEDRRPDTLEDSLRFSTASEEGEKE